MRQCLASTGLSLSLCSLYLGNKMFQRRTLGLCGAFDLTQNSIRVAGCSATELLVFRLSFVTTEVTRVFVDDFKKSI